MTQGTDFSTAGIVGTGSLVQAGPGLLVLTASNSYTGGTTIGGGTLQLGTGAANQDGSIGFTSGVTNNGTLAYNLAGSQTAGYVISGSGGLTKSGPGTLAVAAPNTYGGPTVINGGTIRLKPSSVAAYSYYEFSCTAVSGGTGYEEQLSEFGFYSAGSFNSVGGVAPAGTRVYPNPTDVSGATNNNITFAVNGTTTSPGYGSSLQSLEDNNTGTKFESGGPPPSPTPAAPFTLVFGFSTPQVFTGYDWAQQDSTPNRNPNNWQLLGGNSPTGPWTVLDSETGAGNSTTTNDTWAPGWSISSSAPGSLPTGTALSIAASSTLDMNGASQQVTSLSDVIGAGGGSIINGASGTTSLLTLTPTSGSTTFSGVIAGGGTLGTIGLTMNGPGGMIVLAGPNTYTGATTLTAGTLAVNGSLAAASIVSVGTAATLAGSGLVAGNTTLTGGVINLSGGTLGGTLGVTGGQWNGTGVVAGEVTSNGQFTIASGANLNAANVASGMTVNSGTLAINGNLASSGPVTLAAGALTTIASGGILNATNTSAGVSVNGGTLAVNGTLASTGPVNLGTTASPVLATIPSGGTLNCTNVAGVNVDGGTLAVNGLLSSAAGLSINSATLAGTGIISGTGGVVLNNTTGTFPVVSPGTSGMAGSVGTLTVGGFASFGQANVNFDLSNSISAGNDLIVVNGALILFGQTTVVVNKTAGILATGNYPLFDYTGQLTDSGQSSLVFSAGCTDVAADCHFRLRHHDPGRRIAGCCRESCQSYLGRRNRARLHEHMEPE